MFREKLHRLRKIMINFMFSMCGADLVYAPELREDTERMEKP